MIQNGRVVLAGLLLLFASGLLGASSIRPDFVGPMGVIAAVTIVVAIVTLIRGSLRHPRPT